MSSPSKAPGPVKEVRSALPEGPLPLPERSLPCQRTGSPGPSRDLAGTHLAGTHLAGTHLAGLPHGEAMGWLRDDRSAPAQRSYASLEEANEAYYQRLEANHGKLMYAYKELEVAYSVLENQNLQLHEELEKARSGFDEAFETARLAHDVNTEFYAKLKLAVAGRDDIYEQANTLAAMHHCECHDGRLWCAECRLTYPCPSLEIAIHILQRIDKSEGR